MSNLPISALPIGGPITDTNIFPDVQVVGVGPTQVTALQLKTFIGSGLTLTGAIINNPLTINTVSYTFPSVNGAVGSVLTNSGAGVLSWTAAPGTVSSINADTVSGMGLSFTGGPVATAGTLTLGGILSVANGGTGATTSSGALANLLPPISPLTAGYALFNDGLSTYYWAAAGGGGGGGSGSVTSVSASGGATGLTFSGSPITTSGILTLGGVLQIASGGTGATTAQQAITNLLPSQSGNAGKVLSTNGFGVLSWIPSSGAGTVTSVSVSGGSTGLTASGNPITGSGTITLGGILVISSGGTGATNAIAALNNLLPVQSGNAGKYLTTNGSGTVSWAASGSVTSVSASGGTTGMIFTGSPVTSTGTLTLSGTLSIGSGGTGQTTANAAFNALAPSQSSANGKFLTSNGANTSWAQTTLAGDSDVSITSPVTGNILSYNAGSAKWINNTASGVFSAGTGISITGNTISLANTSVTAGTYSSLPSETSSYTVNAQGQLTAASTIAIQISGIQIDALSIPNGQLTNSSVTIGSTNVALGATASSLAGLNTVTVTADPTQALELATKQYVDAATSSLTKLAPVLVATTTSITLSGPQTVDTVSLTGGERVLVKNQSPASSDGVYVVNGSGAWGYASDGSTWSDYVGASVFVTGGTSNANTTWIQTQPAGGTLGVTNQSWVQQSGVTSYTAGTGLSLVGTQFSNTGVLTFSAAGTGLSPSSPTPGAVVLSGVLNVATGGTGLSAVGSSGTALVSNGTALVYGNPDYANNIFGGSAGQVLYQSATSTTAKLPVGTNGQVLTLSGGLPTWATPVTSSSYRFNISSTLTVSAAITAAGLTDAIGNTYAITNTASNNVSLSTTTFSNATSFPLNATTTTLVIPPKMTAFLSTGAVGNSYVIVALSPASGQTTASFASNTSLTASASVDAFDSVSATATLSSLTLTVPAPTSTIAGKRFSVSNSGTNNFTVTWSGGTSVSTSVVAGNTVSAVWNGTNWVPSYSAAANIIGGAASQVPYQTAPNTTSFVPNGTAGQFLTSNGASAPTWTTAPLSSFHIETSSNGAIPTLISGAGYTDATGNFYTIINTGTTQIVLTAPSLLNSSAYPLTATTTQVTIPAGGTIGINTITAANTYSLDVVSLLTSQSANIGVSSSISLSASNTVDKFNVIRLQPDATGYTVTVPNPTNTAGGRFVSFTNTGSSCTLSLNGGGLLQSVASNATVTFVWGGTSYSLVGTGGATQQQTNYNLTMSGAASLATIISSAGITDVAGNIYVIRNPLTAANITGSFIGFEAWPNQASSGSVTLAQYQVVTVQTITANTQWVVQNIAMSGNLVGGTLGSIPYQSAANTTSLLAPGTTGQLLLSNGSAAPSWLAAGTDGQILIGNTSASPSWLAAGTTGQSLISNGTASPSWGRPPLADYIFGGAASQVLYQVAPNVTGFVANGSSGQSLISNGASAPSWGIPAVATSLAGGSASQIPYQSGPNTTSFISNGTAGQILTSNGTSAPSWTTPTGFGTRAYEFAISVSTNVYAFLTSVGLSNIVDGSVFSFYNPTTTSVDLQFGSSGSTIVNGSSTSASLQTAPGTLTIKAYDTVTVQAYNVAGQQWAFISSALPQDWTCNTIMGTMGALPQNVDTTLNFVTTGGYDPQSAFNNATHAWVCPRPGSWLVTLTMMVRNSAVSANYTYNVQIRLDNVAQVLSKFIALGSNNVESGDNSSTTQTLINCAVGQQVIATMYSYNNTSLTPSNSLACQLNFSLVG